MFFSSFTMIFQITLFSASLVVCGDMLKNHFLIMVGWKSRRTNLEVIFQRHCDNHLHAYLATFGLVTHKVLLSHFRNLLKPSPKLCSMECWKIIQWKSRNRDPNRNQRRFFIFIKTWSLVENFLGNTITIRMPSSHNSCKIFFIDQSN